MVQTGSFSTAADGGPLPRRKVTMNKRLNGRDVLLRAVRNEPTDRAAWLPFVGCHGAALLGVSAADSLKSAPLQVQGLLKALELYRPDGLPVCFDLQIEAEALGCRLHWASDAPPAVSSHPLAEGVALEDLPPLVEQAGRIPVVLDVLRQLKARIGGEVALYGLVCGPFTLALHLLGNDIFLKMFDEPEAVMRIIGYCAGIAKRMADWYLRDGADVIAVVDPMTSQISPEHFETFVTSPVNDVFDHIRARKGLSALFVCGDVTRNLEVMCRTRADSIHVDEQIDMVELRRLAEQQGKAFGGNIKLTVVLLLGSPDDARREALGLLDTCGTRGFILSPGCDLPYGVPPANLQAVADMVHDPYQREVVRNTAAAAGDDAFSDIKLPDYEAAGGVVIDVITLDSTSCAPCQYMMEAVNQASRQTTVRCYINEHKIKVREGIGMMVKLGVKNLPTICIDGTVRFSSIIPDQKTLVAAIEAAARDKAAARI
jgi:uroporphyrinogen decarboxylase